MTDEGGLNKFADLMHPAVAADIERWREDAALEKLFLALQGHTNRKSFLDVYAEALVARHLIQRGCSLAFEVPTPSGKACDFEVRHDGEPFYLHVKRVDTDRPGRRKLTISSRLRNLERIKRPYVVSIRWHEGAGDEQMQRLVRSATEFILHARVGDELVVRDDRGREIGGVLIVAPWEGAHVSLVIGLPSGFIDETQRMRKRLKRAYQQFMPKAWNVILICSSHLNEEDDFISALLGSHVERWDAFPPHGRRIAHGRAADGFWHGGRYADSRIAGWFRLTAADAAPNVQLVHRQGLAPSPRLCDTLTRLFRAQEAG
jgi:hypothetical protein